MKRKHHCVHKIHNQTVFRPAIHTTAKLSRVNVMIIFNRTLCDKNNFSLFQTLLIFILHKFHTITCRVKKMVNHYVKSHLIIVVCSFMSRNIFQKEKDKLTCSFDLPPSLICLFIWCSSFVCVVQGRFVRRTACQHVSVRNSSCWVDVLCVLSSSSVASRVWCNAEVTAGSRSTQSWNYWTYCPAGSRYPTNTDLPLQYILFLILECENTVSEWMNISESVTGL